MIAGTKSNMGEYPAARMASHRGSINSPHRTRNIIMKEWPKSWKFHLGTSPPNLSTKHLKMFNE